jgi:deoxyhypusine synthase
MLRAAIADASAVGVDGPALARAKSRLDEIEAERLSRRRMLGLTSSSVAEGPSDFCCPILFERMVDPVVASDGHTYEREASTYHTQSLT